MRIAVDVSALATPAAGIGRYVDALLRPLAAGSVGQSEWLLYGRRMAVADGRWPGNVRLRCDRLPAVVGRVAGLVSSLPLWAALDRPDVFWGPAHRLPLVLPRRTARVVTIHDLCWLKAPATMRAVTRGLDAWWMPRALRQADRIIAVSHATKRDLVEAFPQVAGRTVVVHEGVAQLPPPLPLEALESMDLTPGYVLFVGTLEPRKNLLRLLQAWAEVPAAEAGDARLVIAGADGWGGLSLDAEVARLGLRERVRMLGRVSDVQLATLYRHALFLAMPSVYEGFGLPLVEALAHGVPVLTSACASMPEVVGDAGLCVDPLNVREIAAGLRRLLNEPALRARLAGRARTQAARFTWPEAADRTMAVLEEAVQVRRGRGIER